MKISNERMLTGLLVDPWKKEVRPIRIEPDIRAWRRVLVCEDSGLDVARLPIQVDEVRVDVWVDDDGFQRIPQPPTWFLPCRQGALCGYGLVLGGQGPDTVSLPHPLQDPGNFLWSCGGGIGWEDWEERMNPIDFPERMI